MFHGILKGRRPKVSSRFSHQSHNARLIASPIAQEDGAAVFLWRGCGGAQRQSFCGLGRLGGSWPANYGFFGKP